MSEKCIKEALPLMAKKVIYKTRMSAIACSEVIMPKSSISQSFVLAIASGAV